MPLPSRPAPGHPCPPGAHPPPAPTAPAPCRPPPSVRRRQSEGSDLRSLLCGGRAGSVVEAGWEGEAGEGGMGAVAHIGPAPVGL